MSANDANEQMYIKLIDGDEPAHSAKVEYRNYGDMNNVRRQYWQNWSIPLTDFTGVNLADVNKIIIGFGDGTTRGTGTVYFEDIELSKVYPPLPHTAKVVYNGNMNDIRYSLWQKWNIPFTDFDDMNLANVKTFTIGFGDGNQAAGNGTVFFEDITLTDGKYISNDPYDEGSIQLFDDPFVFGIWGLFFEGYLPVIDQHCALVDGGYGYIDWYPGLIGKTDSVDWTPDSGIVDIGAHYPSWIFKELGDGSELTADLDGSQTVDFRDFAAFANYWLQPAEGIGDFNDDGFVDYYDLSLLANDWLRNEAIYVDIFMVNDGFESTDVNNISGGISIGPRNIPSDVGEVFIYVDDTQVARWMSGISEWDGFFESDRFSNGPHEIRVMTVDFDYNVVNYEPINADFNNLIYNTAPNSDEFYPLENYHYSGFHDGVNPVEVRILNHKDEELWSNTYSGNYIDINVPGSAFGSAQLCKLSIKETGSGVMMVTGGSDDCEKKIHKKFVREDFFGAKMIILLPSPDVIDQSKLSLICTIISSCEARGVPYGVVYGHDNTAENWTYIFKVFPGRKDIYYAGHANSHIGNVQRTNLVVYKKMYMIGIPWPIETYYVQVPALSYTIHSEPDAERLPGDLDNSGFDLRDLGLKDDDKIEIGWFDGCRTAGRETKTPSGIIIKTPYTDLAETFGFFSWAAQGNHRSIFFGWRIDPQSYPGWDYFGDCFSAANYGQKLIWRHGLRGLGAGGTIQQALEETDGADETILFMLWGEDECRLYDGGSCTDEDNNLVPYGTGNIDNIKLEPN